MLRELTTEEIKRRSYIPPEQQPLPESSPRPSLLRQVLLEQTRSAMAPKLPGSYPVDQDDEEGEFQPMAPITPNHDFTSFEDEPEQSSFVPSQTLRRKSVIHKGDTDKSKAKTPTTLKASTTPNRHIAVHDDESDLATPKATQRDVQEDNLSSITPKTGSTEAAVNRVFGIGDMSVSEVSAVYKHFCSPGKSPAMSSPGSSVRPEESASRWVSPEKIQHPVPDGEHDFDDRTPAGSQHAIRLGITAGSSSGEHTLMTSNDSDRPDDSDGDTHMSSDSELLQFQRLATIVGRSPMGPRATTHFADEVSDLDEYDHVLWQRQQDLLQLEATLAGISLDVSGDAFDRPVRLQAIQAELVKVMKDIDEHCEEMYSDFREDYRRLKLVNMRIRTAASLLMDASKGSGRWDEVLWWMTSAMQRCLKIMDGRDRTNVQMGMALVQAFLSLRKQGIWVYMLRDTDDLR